MSTLQLVGTSGAAADAREMEELERVEGLDLSIPTGFPRKIMGFLGHLGTTQASSYAA